MTYREERLARVVRGFRSFFAKLRPGRRTWEEAVNAYQLELREFYADWSADLADDLASTDDRAEQEEYLLVALLVFEGSMVTLGNRRIAQGFRLGYGPGDMSPRALNSMDYLQRWNASYVGGFRVSILDRLGTTLSDPLVMAGGLVALTAVLGKFASRTEQYAGGMWTAIQHGVGEGAMVREDRRVYWQIDPRAEHCEDCLAYGDREYDSWDYMMSVTGGMAPGFGVQCDGFCRCDLLRVGEDGEFTRP